MGTIFFIQTKSKLIKLVIEKNCKVGSAAKILKINESTAKMVLRKFKRMSVEQQELFFL